MKDKTPTIIWILVLVMLAWLFFSHWYAARQRRAEMQALSIQQHEVDKIQRELETQLADDCKIRREWYGFSCTELKSGKVFRVVM